MPDAPSGPPQQVRLQIANKEPGFTDVAGAIASSGEKGGKSITPIPWGPPQNGLPQKDKEGIDVTCTDTWTQNCQPVCTGTLTRGCTEARTPIPPQQGRFDGGRIDHTTIN